MIEVDYDERDGISYIRIRKEMGIFHATVYEVKSDL